MKNPERNQRAAFQEALARVSRKMRTIFDARVAEHGLTFPRARALFVLSKRDGRTQSELACELELEKATVVRLLDLMEKHGLIERIPVEGDRRANHVVLTELGREKGKLVARIAEDLRQDVLAGIAQDELETGLRLFEKMTANMEAMAGSTSHG